MRSNDGNDMRVQKTLDNVKSAFLKLMQEKSPAQITISALCAEARISRKTFYAHYRSIDALLGEIIENLVRGYVDSIRNLSVPEDSHEMARRFYMFAREQGEFFDHLICSENYTAIGRRLMKRFALETWNLSPWFRPLKPYEQDLLLCFIYSAGTGLYRQWAASGKQIPVGEMIDIANSFLENGIRGFKAVRQEGQPS